MTTRDDASHNAQGSVAREHDFNCGVNRGHECTCDGIVGPHSHPHSVAREINPECWCGLLKSTPHDHKREGPHGTGDLIGVAREGEPQTEAGRALDKYPFHEPTCSKQPTHPDRRCTCGWTERILAIEAEAVKPWREALDESARMRHGLSYVAHARVSFEDCTQTHCVKARALLDESKP